MSSNNSLTNFQPSLELINLLPSIGALCGTTSYINSIEQMAIPELPTVGVTDDSIITDIQSIQAAIEENYPQVKSTAGDWYTNTYPKIRAAFYDLRQWATVNLPSFYEGLSAEASKEDESSGWHETMILLTRMKNEINSYISNCDIAYSKLQGFSTALNKEVKQIQKNYENVKGTLNNLQDYTTKLDEKRAELEEQVAENNKKVAETAKDGLKNMITSSVEIAGLVAGENALDVAKTGAILMIEEAEAGATIISTDLETKDLLKEISGYVRQLNQVNRDLQVLRNAEAQMASLQDGYSISLEVILDLKNYWTDLQDYINSFNDSNFQENILNDFTPSLMVRTWLETVVEEFDKEVQMESTDITFLDYNNTQVQSIGNDSPEMRSKANL